MVYRIIRNLVLLLLATAPLVGAQVYNQFPPPGMAYTNHLTTNSVVAGGSFNATGTTIPANGIYLPSANTLGFTTGGTQYATITAAGVTTAATLQVYGSDVPAGNGGLEFAYTTGVGYLTVYNRQTSTWQPFDLRGSSISFLSNGTIALTIASGGNVVISAPSSGAALNVIGDIQLNSNLFASITAPTISSGFGTSPSIVSNNGTPSFSVNVGTGGVASSGVIGMPAAAHGWACSVSEITTPATDATFQTGSSTTSVTVTNYARTTGVAHAWTASDVLELSCFPN